MCLECIIFGLAWLSQHGHGGVFPGFGRRPWFGDGLAYAEQPVCQHVCAFSQAKVWDKCVLINLSLLDRSCWHEEGLLRVCCQTLSSSEDLPTSATANAARAPHQTLFFRLG